MEGGRRNKLKLLFKISIVGSGCACYIVTRYIIFCDQINDWELVGFVGLGCDVFPCTIVTMAVTKFDSMTLIATQSLIIIIIGEEYST